MIRKIIGIRQKTLWIDLSWSFDKGFSLAFSGYLKIKRKFFSITFFSLKRLEPKKGYINFRIRFPLYVECLRKREPWFDITLANHMLNFGW